MNYEQFKEYDIISLVPNYEVLFKILSSVFISHLGQKNIRLQIWLEFWKQYRDFSFHNKGKKYMYFITPLPLTEWKQLWNSIRLDLQLFKKFFYSCTKWKITCVQTNIIVEWRSTFLIYVKLIIISSFFVCLICFFSSLFW